jgi:drug/metabolite transporter (DMT)-like permease
MQAAAKSQENRVFELALLALLAGLWGSSYLLIKLAVGTIPPVTLVAIRVSLAAVLLFAIMQLQNARFPKDRKIWRLLLVQGMLSSIAPWTLLAWGQQHIDSGLAGVLNSTSPIFVLLITLLVTRHEAVTPWKLGGALLGVLGVALVMGVDVLRGLGQQVAGQLAVLVSALLFAFAAIHGKHFSSMPPTVTAAGTMRWPWASSTRASRCSSTSGWCAPSVRWASRARAICAWG